MQVMVGQFRVGTPGPIAGDDILVAVTVDISEECEGPNPPMVASAGTGVSGRASHVVDTAATRLGLGADDAAGNKPIRTDKASQKAPINGTPDDRTSDTTPLFGQRWDPEPLRRPGAVAIPCTGAGRLRPIWPA